MDDEQLLRYSRHILLPQVDLEGQEKLQLSKVLIVGLGGLGSPVALYLAAAGIGELLLCDYDRVELSNLQRQILHGVEYLGKYKVDSAIDRLGDINPQCKVSGLTEAVSEEMLEQLLNPTINKDSKQLNLSQDSTIDSTIDLVIDCTDNLTSRLLINQACVKYRTKLLSGAAIRMEGQVSVFLNQGDGPCYQCLFSTTQADELSCSEAGVLATTVGIIGTLQAQEALKILMDIGDIKDGSLLLMDGMTGDWKKLTISRKPDCLACGKV